MTPSRADVHDAVVVSCLALAGVVILVAHPRRTLRLLRGEGWYG